MNQKKVQRNFVLPGDKLATIEEFEAGPGSMVKNESIIASVVGEVHSDMAKRLVEVEPAKEIGRLPQIGDYIVGSVESVSSSVAQVNIKAINNVDSNKDFSAMLSLREDRRSRFGPVLKPSDVIRAKVTSTTNSIYQLGMDCENCGVIFTVCSYCGGNVVALGRNRIKCRECGTVDERMLSEEFVSNSRNLSSA